jgi:outer membrane protein assembly factor BamA
MVRHTASVRGKIFPPSGWAMITLFLFVLLPGSSAWGIEDQLMSMQNEIQVVEKAVREVVKIAPPEEGKSDFVIMPIPISNPTVGTGLGLASMFLYPADQKSPISSTTFGGFYSSSESWGAGVAQKTFLYEDRLRLNGLAGYGNINMDFYGIGSAAGNNGVSVPITQKGFFFMPEALTRITGRLYGGLRYRYLGMETVLNLNELAGKGINLPPITGTVKSSAVGLVMNYDSRDNSFNPSGGIFLDGNAIFAAEALGSDFDYQIYQAAYNQYFQIADRMVLAYRAFGKFTAGRVPIFDLAFFGSHSDLRGYPGGLYVDKMMIATQVEYRWRFWKKWGMVAFAGIGEVAPKLSEFGSGNYLPSYGAGLRYMVSEANRVNISMDYARGKAGDGVYFYIGEAF